MHSSIRIDTLHNDNNLAQSLPYSTHSPKTETRDGTSEEGETDKNLGIM